MTTDTAQDKASAAPIAEAAAPATPAPPAGDATAQAAVLAVGAVGAVAAAATPPAPSRVRYLVGGAVALAVATAFVWILASSFGTDPREVPFMLSGKRAPNFTVKRLDNGQPLSLSEFAGKPVVINFWATWCGPCKAEHPVLEWAAKRYKDRVVFIGIVFEDTEKATKGYLDQHDYWTMFQLYDAQSTVAVDYGVAGVPETYFITRDGKILGKYAAPIDPETLTLRIAELLK